MIGRAAVLDTASPPSRLRSVVVACGLYALLGGAISFAGYVFDVQRLTDWDGNGISIQPNAAVCAALSGLAL
ncbi:MAG: hypothetical protein K2Q09_01075, partial [Phycisphaerales bacterium]|nr:hypothetical protein [Phycisphaerales bacterium]